jgi:putative salt-induced outer membrane protein
VLTALSGSWKIAPYLTFSEDASALSGDGNVNVTTLSALFQVSKKLSTRVSYQILYNTNPPTDYKPLDRLTRFTLVYGF